MKKYVPILTLLIALTFCLSAQGRKQWSEKQAWKWYEKVGIIKGFNQPEPPYPGMPLEELLKKAHEMGLNSVRFWTGGNPDAAIDRINLMKAAAKPYNITLSPVLSVSGSHGYFTGTPEEQALARERVRNFIQKVVGTFANDEQIIMWDIYNEPGQLNFKHIKLEHTIRELKLVSEYADLCYEMNPKQAITASIYWRSDILDVEKNELSKLCFEVERKMDVHNFHNYSFNRPDRNEKIVSVLERNGHRPMICTECITRVNGSGFGRTMPQLAKHHMGFYIWGLYANDANWEVAWGRSTYNPYEPFFHDLVYPDGEPYDWRDIETLRQYKYAAEGENPDPGVEKTDKWSHARAWRWMALGPVKGKCMTNVEEVIDWINKNKDSEYNSVRVMLDYQLYKNNSKLFFEKLDSLVKLAKATDITILPTLLTDKYAHYPIEELAAYGRSVIDRYYQNGTIQAWDLYYHPGEQVTDKTLLSTLLKRVFQECRYAFANQPLTATPYVSVKPFEKDFDYIMALKHGTRNGWRQLQHDGGASEALTYQIWCMSDVLSFSTVQPAAETGWLMSLAFRFGRPLFCTDWQPVNETDANNMLSNFRNSHVFWYQESSKPVGKIQSFKFKPITTGH